MVHFFWPGPVGYEGNWMPFGTQANTHLAFSRFQGIKDMSCVADNVDLKS
jgi:hypothetical protein